MEEFHGDGELSRYNPEEVGSAEGGTAAGCVQPEGGTYNRAVTHTTSN